MKKGEKIISFKFGRLICFTVFFKSAVAKKKTDLKLGLKSDWRGVKAVLIYYTLMKGLSLSYVENSFNTH